MLNHWSIKKHFDKRAVMFLSITVLTIMTLGFRLINIGRESMWFDEAVSYLVATLPVREILENAAQSSHPPLYYLFLHYWQMVFPDSDANARLLGVLMSILLVPSLYWLAQILFGQRSLALWAALLVAISPFQVLYSHELRMYAQFMLLVVLVGIAFLKAEQTNLSVWWVAFTLLSMMAIYTHLFFWLFLAALGIYTLIRHRFDHVTRRIALIYILLMLLFVPWLQNLLGESEPELGSMRPILQESSLNPVKPLTSLTFLVYGMSSKILYSGLSLFLLLSYGVIFILEVRKVGSRAEAKRLLLPVLAVSFIVGIPVLIYMVRPFFLPERTLAAASPFLMIIFAWGTTRKGTPLPYLVYLTIVVLFVGTVIYLIGDPIKPPYRDVVALVEEEYKPGDAVLHTSDGSYFPALRYTSIKNQAVLAGDPDPRKPEEVYELLGGEVWSKEESIGKGTRLWLIIALEHSIDWQQEQAAYYRENYPSLESFEIGGIQVYLYDLAHPITAQ